MADKNKEYHQLLRLVEEMRRLQKRFFAMKRDNPERESVMKQAKEYERKVDDIVKKQLSPELF